MEIPAARWNAAIPGRRSRRSFDSSEPAPHALMELEAVCREFQPFPGARSVLVAHSADSVLRGVVGSYGKVTGALAFVAFIGDTDDPHVNEKVGYTGEGIILEATAMGLDTCWVGGFFRPRVAASLVGVVGNERVMAVTPVGHALGRLTAQEKTMTGFGRTHRRKSLAELVTGLGRSEWPSWMEPALEAARLAPSAVNRQPWRFRVDAQGVTVSVDSPRFNVGISKRLDCGIAMLHLEVAALARGVKGAWELVQPPDVARFTVASHGEP